MFKTVWDYIDEITVLKAALKEKTIALENELAECGNYFGAAAMRFGLEYQIRELRAENRKLKAIYDKER